MSTKTILIQNRLFVRGSTERGCCATKFKFLWPVDVLPFWDELCSDCCMALPDILPSPGEIVIEWEQGRDMWRR